MSVRFLPPNSGFNGCVMGALFGVFIFPVAWTVALYAIPAYNEAGEEIQNPGTALSVLFMFPLAIVGGIVFGVIGALIGSVTGERKYKG
jgi:hypothetical protein